MSQPRCLVCRDTGWETYTCGVETHRIPCDYCDVEAAHTHIEDREDVAPQGVRPT